MNLSSALRLAVLPASTNAFAFLGPMHNGRSTTSLNAAVIYYSSSTGNTETVARYISEAAGGLSMDDIGDASASDLEGSDALIVGAPTWHTGANDQRSGTALDDWLYDTLPSANLKGKKVAIFGCGDRHSYGDYYCDAAGELYQCFKGAGCKVYGFTSTDGYDHVESKAEVESGKFCGLMFDEDKQYDLSEDRAKNWVSQLKDEGFF